jgi:hypothetical protein
MECKYCDIGATGDDCHRCLLAKSGQPQPRSTVPAEASTIKAGRLEPLESGLDAMRERDKLAECCACGLGAKLAESCRRVEELQAELERWWDNYGADDPVDALRSWGGPEGKYFRELERKIAALRRWVEGQECECKSYGLSIQVWHDSPCSRCQIVATWGGETSKHPGLKEREAER